MLIIHVSSHSEVQIEQFGYSGVCYFSTSPYLNYFLQFCNGNGLFEWFHCLFVLRICGKVMEKENSDVTIMLVIRVKY